MSSVLIVVTLVLKTIVFKQRMGTGAFSVAKSSVPVGIIDIPGFQCTNEIY